MFKFKKDRVLLLRELQQLVNESIDASKMNPQSDEEVSYYMIDVTDKRRARKLKVIKQELEKWIKEARHDKILREQERLFNESKTKGNYVNVAHRD